MSPDKKTSLRLVVGHHPKGDWRLIVRADDKALLDETIGKDVSKNGWVERNVDLTHLAGKSVQLELVNQATGWRCEWGRWAEIAIVEE